MGRFRYLVACALGVSLLLVATSSWAKAYDPATVIEFATLQTRAVNWWFGDKSEPSGVQKAAEFSRQICIAGKLSETVPEGLFLRWIAVMRLLHSGQVAFVDDKITNLVELLKSLRQECGGAT